jgi:Sap, sulfolipid-1-addressing protein
VGNAIGQVLPFAVGVLLSPMPVIAVVLMLVTAKARVNGPVFLLGWIAGLAVVGAIALSLVGVSPSSNASGPATWASVLKLVLGVLLLALAFRSWKARPEPGQEVPMPKWMNAIDTFTAPKAAGIAFFLSSINPKNLLLIIAGAAAVAQTGASGADQAVAWVVFTVIASIGVAAPVVIFFAMGDRATAILQNLRGWMAHNNSAIMAVLCLIIGVKLIGDAISGFST